MFVYGRRAGYMSVVLLVFAVAPLVSAAVCVPQMGDRIALGFNVAGEVTRWGSRYEMLYAPILCLLLGAAMYVTAQRQAHANLETMPAASRFTYTRFIRKGIVTVVVLNIVNAYLMFSALTGIGLSF